MRVRPLTGVGEVQAAILAFDQRGVVELEVAAIEAVVGESGAGAIVDDECGAERSVRHPRKSRSPSCEDFEDPLSLPGR